MTPTISLLTTVYNGQRYLEATLHSVLAQTFRDFEYIIVDDGSTDDTPRILQRYADLDDRIRVIRQANAGISRAANAGLAHCRAPLLARTDSDDLLKPNRLQVQLDFMRNSDAVAAGTFVDFMDHRGRLLTTITCPTEDQPIQEALLSGACAIWNTSSMMRREAVERVGGYCPECDTSEDLDMWLRLGEIGTLANVPQSLQMYRIHPGGVSETAQAKQTAARRHACERAYKRRGLDREYVDPGNWRPGRDKISRFEFAVRYGWWAYQSGQRRTAMYYATRAVRLRPTVGRGWKLLACATLKPLPQRTSTEGV